ncbi:Gfo/Idh/MocA family protein [Alkalitalea saponilacus]|uniref:Predicted dehydrogenase n=1 Tax=Alkalitalea saponilacus TaxID=889453 RepID=A0A1T5HSM0_9BACT|nr:Gfo/Idh/MocA family oxidoreductase [Alkalitalea saponilacus]ASB49211.1 oxidoreductase [Alkalitalea saponilacus]SKC23693.1 Predicted dehydrogenase [Alkalitalea saponilacus]
MHKPIKFAVIGLGHIGKRHAAMIKGNPNASLVAVCDVLDANDTGFNDPETPYYKSISELLDNELEVDVVNICTPNGFHASQTLEALEARKHVVVEKPMALSKQDAEQVIFKALQVSRQVFTVMQNRYSPPVKWLRQIIQEERLGKIFMVQMNCFWNRDDRYYKPGGWHGTADLDGGVLFTQFSHFMDIMYWLFGDICNIKGNFGNFAHRHSTKFEDAGSVVFKFVNGGMGSINYSTAVWDRNLESSITIIGERGTVKIAGQYMDDVSCCHIQDYEMPELEPVNPPNDYGGYKGSASNHAAVIENVVETLNGNTEVATNALEGMKIVDIIERIYQVRGPGEEI